MFPIKKKKKNTDNEASPKEAGEISEAGEVYSGSPSLKSTSVYSKPANFKSMDVYTPAKLSSVKIPPSPPLSTGAVHVPMEGMTKSPAMYGKSSEMQAMSMLKGAKKKAPEQMQQAKTDSYTLETGHYQTGKNDEGMWDEENTKLKYQEALAKRKAGKK